MNINAGINFDQYEKIPVDMTGPTKAKPISSFSEPGFDPQIMENIALVKFNKPTPIQRYAIPIIMANEDLMATAQTGSGKTAAYLLPVFQKMLADGVRTDDDMSSVATPTMLVVVPTRELCIQVYEQCRLFARGVSIFPQRLYGGPATGYMKNQLMGGCNVLVATTGRLKDFLDRGWVSLEKCKYIVLDEADRMLDMGFQDDIATILGRAVSKDQRQLMMFSATFSRDVQVVARQSLKDGYTFLVIGTVGAANKDVTQDLIEVAHHEKMEQLLKMLEETKDAARQQKTIVFVETKRTADIVAARLSQDSYPSTSIHGDRQQREREQALSDFRRGKRPILVATSVAARGLDIRGVEMVINYDLPKEIDTYVHRIGRTGRCGHVGKSVSFYNHNDDSALAEALMATFTKSECVVPEWLAMYADQGSMGGYGMGTTRDTRGGVNHTREMAGGGGDDDWGAAGGSSAPAPAFSAAANADDEEW